MSYKLGKVKYVFLAIIIMLIIYMSVKFYDITAQEIVGYKPNNSYLAFLMLMGIFAIKSLSVFIPLVVLYVSGTLIFTSRWAILVNLIGLMVSMSIPYFIGKYAASNFVQRIFYKYPKVGRINDKSDNEFILVFIVKVMGFIPNDISSLLLGSLDVNYFIFLIVSMLVRVPMMLFMTTASLKALGLEEMSTTAIGTIILICIGTLFILYRKYREAYDS